MPRRKRICPAGFPVHVVQRGNNRQTCFADHADKAAYAHWLQDAARLYGLAIHAWVLMTNHIHMLVTPDNDAAVSQTMQYLGRYYVRYFNFRYDRTGTLFEGRFRSSLVQSDEHLLACLRYIELNPVRAGMVSAASDYAWSSYRANALGIGARMWTPHPVYLRLGSDVAARADAYRQAFGDPRDETGAEQIRSALNRGLALGDDRFRFEVEQLTGQRQRLAKRGPKPATEPGRPTAADEFLL